MTTKIKIEAHCDLQIKEVVVFVIDNGRIREEQVLQDGDVAEIYAYDERQIFVREICKE